MIIEIGQIGFIMCIYHLSKDLINFVTYVNTGCVELFLSLHQLWLSMITFRKGILIGM